VIEFEDYGLRRGVRTMGEVAHFIRCIPFKVMENNKIWASPDFLMTIRVGTISEHALLLASMFRTVKFETVKELEASTEY
jgi:hypothetical protein